TNGIIGQTYSTQNKLKNITVSGSIDNSTLLPEECGVEYNFGSEQEQYAGVYEGIKVSLNVKQPLGFTQQPRIVCRKLLDNILFDNYKSNSTPLINIPKSIEYSVKSTNSESLEDTLLKIRASKSRAITASTLTLN